MFDRANLNSVITTHRDATRSTTPLVSLVLLDWSVREHFQALKWLNQQDVPRECYELIWVELFERVAPEAMESCDVVITCGQQGIYHKHKAYNIGVLQARGAIITICDSDAIFPPNFVRSLLDSFRIECGEPIPQVLMHHQWRTQHEYPEDFHELSQIARYHWLPLKENIGACASFRKEDVLRFGGFDEHRSFRGYLCGPYDLGWRLVNAGIPEHWHDVSVASWHFAHPAPSDWRGRFSWSKWREKRHPHIDHIALSAIEAYARGRVLPLQENAEIFRQRMATRQHGSPYEAHYGDLQQIGAQISQAGKIRLRAAFIAESFTMEGRLRHTYRDRVLIPLVARAQKLLNPRLYQKIRSCLQFFTTRRSSK